MKYKTAYITGEQAERQLTQQKGTEWELAIFLALRCGLRRCETMEFQAGDFDRAERVLHVPYRKREGCLLQRDIQLSEKDSLRLNILATCNHNEYKYYSVRYVTDNVRRRCYHAGLTGVGLREVQHTAVSEVIMCYVREGMKVKDACEWAGYSDYSTFCNVYSAILRVAHAHAHSV